MRKHRDIKLVATEEKRIKLASEPNYHATKHFSKKIVSNRDENEKNKDE